MKPKLHHINLSTKNVEEMAEFYKDILFLEREKNDIPKLEKGKFYSGEVKFMSDGDIQTHLAEIDNDLSFKTGLAINPLSKGHIAFRVEDLDQFKKHLITHGINYADWGEKAVSGWKQVFFHDPDGNIVEVHEKIQEK
tara:strand:- start:61 stop:474 length:414 start_codon:yes stop_codon:yes gene_type:complete